jgi:HPt (histidine-containing phosphotransfer) domain-containing protein
MSLLGLFREQFAKTGEALLPQVEARDFAALQREAHDLKSGAGNIGARRVWRAADALDRACWEERTGDIEGAAVELRAALDELLEALADLLDTLEDDTARSRAG